MEPTEALKGHRSVDTDTILRASKDQYPKVPISFFNRHFSDFTPSRH